MREFTRYSRSISNNNGAGLPMHRPDNPIGVREDTSVAVRSAGKQFYDPGDGSLVGAWLMDEGSGLFVRDHSGYGNHGKTIANPVWVDDGIDFEFSSSQYVLGDSTDIFLGATDPNYTILSWFNQESATETPLFHQGPGSGNDALGMHISAGSVIRNYWWSNDLDGVIVLPTSTWNLAGCTFDGTTRKTYANGVFDTQDTPVGHTLDGATVVQLAARTISSSYADGVIHSIFVYNKALTAEIIASIYAAGRYRLTESFKVPNV